MNNNDAIISILEELKSKLNANFETTIIDQWGKTREVTFTFNEPTSIEKLNRFKKEFDWVLPKDYKNILLIHNGLDIFEDENGSGFELYPIDDIIENHLDYFLDGWYPIGYYRTLQGHLIIDSNKVEKGDNNYLIYFDSDDADEHIVLEMNFEQWLDKFIKTNGAYFWE